MEINNEQLQNILDLSFNEYQNENISYENSNDANVIKNLELVNNMFINVCEIQTCNICYDDSINCIKCNICRFYYCKTCLVKIIKLNNKCSCCNKNFDNRMFEKMNIKNNIVNYQNNCENSSSDSDVDDWINKNINYKKYIISLCDNYNINPIKRKNKSKKYNYKYDYKNNILIINTIYKNDNPIIIFYKDFDYFHQKYLLMILDAIEDDEYIFKHKWNKIIQEINVYLNSKIKINIFEKLKKILNYKMF